MRKRVAITGMGVVSPIGIGLDEYWEGLLSGRVGVGPITAFDASDYPCRVAAEVLGFKPSDYFDRKKARLMARGTQFGVASATLCLEDANWDHSCNGSMLGVAAGISNSPQDTVEEAVMQLRDHGYRRALPYQLNKSLPHGLAAETGTATGFQQSVMTFATACTAGMNALGYAIEEIRQGRLYAILCPAADANIAKYAFGYFCKAGMLTSNNEDPQHASRPFDLDRDGGVLGEAGACLLLEDFDCARRRGASIYAEIIGYGTTGIGYNPGEQQSTVSQGMAKAMSNAMKDANCHPEQIDYIGAHGVSDRRLDLWETNAAKEVFGKYAYRLPLSSAKAQIGIPQNAAGILQMIATVMAVREGILPPTVNYDTPDPECDLDYVPNEPRHNRVQQALTLAHGFNGSDAAVIIRRAEGA